MMHQALLSFITIPFILFHRQRTVVVLLLCSDAPGALPPHTHIIIPLLVSHHRPIRPLLFVSTTAAREWSPPSATVRGGADSRPVLGVYNYVLNRKMRDRAENPTVCVGVGVVHQVLAAPHTTRGVLRFTVCLTDAVVRWPMNGRLSHNKHSIQAHLTRLAYPPSGRLVTLRALHSLCLEHSWREVRQFDYG